MHNNSVCLFVTGFYDIGRATFDNRDMEQYFEWLSELVETLPNLIIYHDKSLDETKRRILFDKNQNTSFIFLPLEQLPLYSQYTRIREMCGRYKENSNDLVYKVVEYGILIHSKIDLIIFASRLFENYCHLVWIDAGITRFVKKSNRVAKCIAKYDNNSFFVELSTRGNLQLLSFLQGEPLFKNPAIGSSRRLIGGSLIVVGQKAFNDFNERVEILRSEWERNSAWDTEQIFLSELIKDMSNIRLYIQKRSKPTSIFSDLSRNRSLRLLRNNISLKIINGYKKKTLPKLLA